MNKQAANEQARSLFVPATFLARHGVIAGVPMGIGAFAHPQEKGKGAFRGMLLGRTVPWGALAGALTGAVAGGVGGGYLGRNTGHTGAGALAGGLVGTGLGGLIGGFGTKKTVDTVLDHYVPYHEPELNAPTPDVETPKDPGALEEALAHVIHHHTKQSSWAFRLGQEFSKNAG